MSAFVEAMLLLGIVLPISLFLWAILIDFLIYLFNGDS